MKNLFVILFVLILVVGCSQQTPIKEEALEDLNQEIASSDIESDDVLTDIMETEKSVEDAIELVEEPVSEKSSEKELSEKELSEESYTSSEKVIFEELFNYNERTYYYDNGFGVDDVNYKGSLPIMESGEKFTLRIYDTLNNGIDIDVNHKMDTYENTGMLYVGDSYVTKQGVKITLQEVYSNKIVYTLEKVDSSEWSNPCSECYSAKSLRTDDGMRYADSSEEKIITYAGESYKIRVEVIDRLKGQVRLVVDRKELPILESNDIYVLESGAAIKYVFGVAHLLSGEDYGYVGFGFLDTHELPYVTMCPQCNDFIIKDKIYKYGRETFDVSLVGSILKFGDDSYTLSDTFVPLTKGISAKLITSTVVGLKFDGEEEPIVYCSESTDSGIEYDVKGSIKVSVVKESNSFFREDMCVDDNILVEYSCVHIDDRSGGNGKGWTGIMEYKQCPCQDGACI